MQADESRRKRTVALVLALWAPYVTAATALYGMSHVWPGWILPVFLLGTIVLIVLVAARLPGGLGRPLRRRRWNAADTLLTAACWLGLAIAFLGGGEVRGTSPPWCSSGWRPRSPWS